MRLASSSRGVFSCGSTWQIVDFGGALVYPVDNLTVPFGTYTLNLESIPEPLDYDTPVINA